MDKYPEHEKVKQIQPKSQAIGGFLSWLQGERGLVIAKWHEEADLLISARVSTEDLLAEFFDIDLVKFEEEKRQMLNEARIDLRQMEKDEL